MVIWDWLHKKKTPVVSYSIFYHLLLPVFVFNSCIFCDMSLLFLFLNVYIIKFTSFICILWFWCAVNNKCYCNWQFVSFVIIFHFIVVSIFFLPGSSLLDQSLPNQFLHLSSFSVERRSELFAMMKNNVTRSGQKHSSSRSWSQWLWWLLYAS